MLCLIIIVIWKQYGIVILRNVFSYLNHHNFVTNNLVALHFYSIKVYYYGETLTHPDCN